MEQPPNQDVPSNLPAAKRLLKQDMEMRNDSNMMTRLYEKLLQEKAAYLANYDSLEVRKRCLLKYFNSGKDGNANITIDEFRDALKRMNITGTKVEDLFFRYDADGSGELSPEEFVDGVFASYKSQDLGKSVLEYDENDSDDNNDNNGNSGRSGQSFISHASKMKVLSEKMKDNKSLKMTQEDYRMEALTKALAHKVRVKCRAPGTRIQEMRLLGNWFGVHISGNKARDAEILIDANTFRRVLLELHFSPGDATFLHSFLKRDSGRSDGSIRWGQFIVEVMDSH